MSRPKTLYSDSLCFDRSLHQQFWIPLQLGKHQVYSALQDDDLTLNTSTPDLTPCFQQTVLLWVPCGSLWLSLPFYITYLRSRPKWVYGYHRRSKLNSFKLFSGSVLLLVTLAWLAYLIATSGSHSRPLVTYLAPALATATYFVAVALASYEYTQALHSSGVLVLFWFFMVVVGAVRLRSEVIGQQEQEPEFAVSCVAFSLTALQMLLNVPSDHGVKGHVTSEKTPLLKDEVTKDSDEHIKHPCPEDKASFLSSIFFFWITRLILKGYRRTLTFADVYKLRMQDRCQKVIKTFYSHWEDDPHNIKLWWALFKTVQGPVVLGSLLSFIRMAAQLSTPVVLGSLINFVGSTDPYQWKGYFLAVVLFLLQIVFSISAHNSGKLSSVAGMRLRTAVIAAVYRKKAQMVFKDQRIKSTNEILSGIKILKFYAWEQSFFGKLNEIREKELSTFRRRIILNVFIGVCWLSAPYLVSLVVFSIYALTSGTNSLPPEKAFVSLNIIKTLNSSLVLLPVIMTFSTQAVVSMKRIRKMLLSEELDHDAVKENMLLEEALRIDNGQFTWDEDDKPVLSDINMKVERGKLIAVVGQVGSGKSSLLNAMLGELRRVKGQVTKQGTFAYVAQQAWIQNLTLKENILFGQHMDTHRYKKILEACALMPDLEILPSADDTEIGEKGINLSGGQKQRVNLARAVYQDCDIYLLDDILSAVDAHVGKQLFENVLGPTGILKCKTRVLVTHNVTFLPEMDEIVVLKDGHVAESGTYQKLMEQEGPFADFIRTYLKEKEDTDDDLDPHAREVRQSLVRQLSQTSGSETTDQEMKDASNRQRRKHSSENPSEKESTGPFDKTAADKAKIKAGKIVEKEMEETGRISMSVALNYLRSCGISMPFISAVGFLIYVAMATMTNIWLSMWSDDVIPVKVTEARALTNLRLTGYGVLGAGQVLAQSILSSGIMLGALWASRKIHTRLIQRILHAPSSFFDTTPLGRILNRFSSDMERVDNTIPTMLGGFCMSIANFVRIIIINTYSTPIYLAAFVPIFIAYLIFQRVYMSGVRQLKRIESVRRSPIYSHFDETLHGISTIRAYSRQKRFTLQNQKLVDENQMAWYPILISQRWMGVTLHCSVGCLLVLFASVFAVLQRDTLSAGLAGLSISFSLDTIMELMTLTLTASDLETYAVSIERIKEYSEAPQEGTLVNNNYRPDPYWPSRGEVEFSNYSTRYRPGLDLVLSDVSAKITGGEKIGIVGRTGAGKSSMTLALFRLIEPAGGSIHVDGMNIAEVGLRDLRSQLTIIPQDPVLFAGSLRMNLDPFSIHKDDQIWNALEHAHLKTFVESLTDGLEHHCGEGGTGLSVGQRQLLCLARALLRKSRILVLDEATAAVDMETDDLIQATIRQEFRQCTVITIAHRINTIMDYDRVMVLDKGKVCEFDQPSKLLAVEDGMFYQLAKNAGLL